jgi:DNA-binding NtrC family response regulator
MKKELSSQKRRILIVDDESAIVGLLNDILRAFEYATIGIQDPLKALELFKKEHDSIDLVLTDLTMPNLSGLKLARLMNQIKKSTPIVILTGDSETLAEELLQEDFISGVLNKPMMAGELIETIQHAICQTELEFA